MSFYSARKILFGLVFAGRADQMDRGTTEVGRVIKLYFQSDIGKVLKRIFGACFLLTTEVKTTFQS